MKRRALLFACVFCSFGMVIVLAQPAEEMLRAAKDKEERNAAGAIEIYKQIIAEQGADAQARGEAYLRMGMCLAGLGRRDEARAAIEKAMQLCPGRPDFRVLADVALFRLREGFHQVHRAEVDRQGRAKFITETRTSNTSGKEQNIFGFYANVGKLIEVRDASGKKVPFWWEKREDGMDYTIGFDNLIPPGGEVYYETIWEMERLVVRKEDRLLYQYGPHSPGPHTLYEHVLILPPNSELEAAIPTPAIVCNTEAGKIITWQKELQAGESVDLRAEFRIPEVDVFGLAVPDYFDAINKQTNVITVDADGKAMARSEGVERNDGVVPLSRIFFSSGSRAKLIKVLDDQDKELEFIATPMGERTMYIVQLLSAIPPGEERTIQSFYEVDGLVAREGDAWVYQYRHSPGPETFYSHTLRLPGNAEILEVVPKADDTAVVDGMKTVSWASIIPRGVYFSCRVKYRLGGKE